MRSEIKKKKNMKRKNPNQGSTATDIMKAQSCKKPGVNYAWRLLSDIPNNA